MNLFTKQTHRLERMGRVGEGTVREFGINMYTLLYLKWITNKNLLYSTWWWTGRPGMLQSMRSQIVGYDWVTELMARGKVFPVVMYRCAAAAAKSLQSCLTLRNPMDCSLPGSSVHGIFQARVLEWGAIAFSMYKCESWTIKKAECWRTDAFELWCWRRLLRIP